MSITHTDTPPRPAPYDVQPGVPAAWPGIGEAAAVVTRFLATVRLTGDPAEAAAVLAPTVLCHQVVSDRPETITRTPAEYARHVREDILGLFGPLALRVEELLEDGDRVYVRWRQTGTGPLVDVASAVYRVSDGRIAEYWIQLDRLGLERQLAAGASNRDATRPQGAGSRVEP